MKLTPAHLDGLRTLFEGRALIPRARVFVVGGEALNPGTVAFWRGFAPDIRIVNEYGPTETVVGTSIHEIEALSEAAADVPIGRASPNTRLYVLDSSLEPVATAIVGELYIAGDQVGTGYLNRPGLTASRFLADPHGHRPGARMYRTGDLAHWDGDGVLHCHGRIDDQVKIRGYRIEPAEVEAVIAGQPGVAGAAVIVHSDRVRGSRLVAFVSPAGLDLDALRAAAAARLPDYMIPAAFCALETLPVTLNGKIDRRLLGRRAAELKATASSVPPSGETERLLAGIWQEVLGVEAVGRDDNFFDLGGHSLLAMRIPGRVRRALAAEITVRDVMDTGSLAELARLVEAVKATAGDWGSDSDAKDLEEVEL